MKPSTMKTSRAKLIFVMTSVTTNRRSDAKGSASVSVDVSIAEGELQPPKIDECARECDKAKNETFFASCAY